MHARNHVRGAWSVVDMKRDQHVSCLGQLVIAPHASGLTKPLPVRPEELMLDRVLPGPAVAEHLRAPSAAREDLRDAMALRRQDLAQALVVGERP